MRNFEVVPDGERIIPIEQSWAWKLSKIPGALDLFITMILGKSRKRICVNTHLYANPGKRFHWDVLAEDEKDLGKVLKINWLRLTLVTALFGEALTGYKTI